MAHELGFAGRQASTPLAVPTTRPQRRHKTGRNIQINIKGDIDTKEELYRIADDIDQPLGETLKRALSAIRREISQ
jgi:hypothetical protein